MKTNNKRLKKRNHPYPQNYGPTKQNMQEDPYYHGPSGRYLKSKKLAKKLKNKSLSKNVKNNKHQSKKHKARFLAETYVKNNSRVWSMSNPTQDPSYKVERYLQHYFV